MEQAVAPVVDVAPDIISDEAIEPSGLPSEQVEPVTFEVSPEDLKDGKYLGRWNNPKEMAEYIKSMEDKHSNLTREIKNNEQKTDEEIASMASEESTKQKRIDTIREFAPEFMKNGMQLTDEMKQALTDTGLSEMEIKVGAYELKEALDKNAGYVGGKENYDIIMNYHADNMSDDEKRQFNHSIEDPNNSKALMLGLKVMYEESISGGEQAPKDRVRGNPASTSIKPYESKQELLRDKKYADSRTASQADKAKFRQRLSVTPEDVWKS